MKLNLKKKPAQMKLKLTPLTNDVGKPRGFDARGGKNFVEVIITDREFAEWARADTNDLLVMGSIAERLKKAGIPISSFFLYNAPEYGKLTTWRDEQYNAHFLWEGKK